MTNSAPVLPGEMLAGKYRVERLLGQGGMGVVVAAKHIELDERVAIKFLAVQSDPAAIDRFIREARAAAKVKSEHVCRVHDVARLESGEPYIVMEYLEGQDLADMLAQKGPLPVDVVAGWIIEACDALAEAHAAGIIHRDLKPANIFLAARGDGSASAKVLDFGISKLPNPSLATKTSNMMGTPSYMAPEQMESSRNVDARADVWSMGVVLYELLIGDVPFDADSLVQLAVQIREAPHVPPSQRRPDLPAGVDEIVARCLAKSPDDRYPGVAELALALAPFASEDVSAIVRRLARRVSGSVPRLPLERDSDPAFHATEPDRPAMVVTPKTPVRAAGAESGRAPHVRQATFDPMTSPPSESTRRSRKRVTALTVVGACVVTALVAFAVVHKRPEAARPDATDRQPTTVLSSVASAAPLASSNASPSLEPAKPIESAPPKLVSSQHPVAPARTARTQTALQKSTDRTPVATPVVTAEPPPAEPPATPRPVDSAGSRKRRQLDRSDPFAQ